VNTRTKSPGTYDVKNGPRKKHFNKKNVFISEEKRFNLAQNNTPGPGAYIDNEES
jgi:hypothetical protein